jgi:hypothetical protein
MFHVPAHKNVEHPAGQIVNCSAASDPDFTFANHGSICILNALSPAAVEWVDEHLPEDRQLWGSNGTVIEPRYVAPILEGIVAEGLVIA